MALPFVDGIRRADRDNTIDVYISDDHDDVLRDGTWQLFFKEKPEPLTREEKREWISRLKGVALGSDAFFPFWRQHRARPQERRGVHSPGRRLRARRQRHRDLRQVRHRHGASPACAFSTTDELRITNYELRVVAQARFGIFEFKIGWQAVEPLNSQLAIPNRACATIRNSQFPTRNSQSRLRDNS